MTNNVDFDELARKANQSGGAMEDLNKLFGAAFALEKWLFIARGELPNVNPYIASNVGYADGQQMIRSFTDVNRLQRFARENNLTKADGSVLELDVPTVGIVDYLEQFIAQGIHGVWFNSDTQSDGFFIPLKQLRPVKDYLAKLQSSGAGLDSGVVPPADSQKSGKPNRFPETVIIIINDGLMLPSGFIKKADYICNLYCLVPNDWTQNGKLKESYLEKFFEKMYGATWRAGNSDGSRYVVENSFSLVLTDEDLKGINWTTTTNDKENHFWFYVVEEKGEIKTVAPPEFQKDFDAARQSPAPSAQKVSNLEDWGLSRSPDGDVDLNIKIFRSGNVKFGTTLIPFYAEVSKRLKDYQGSGEFEKIFNFAPETMSDLTENFSSNQHGRYFRVRRFQYHPPNATAEAMTIDSNQLQHIETGATLKCSFVMLKISGNPTSALYFGFEGNRREVEKLLSAIAPALEAAEFVAEKPR